MPNYKLLKDSKTGKGTVVKKGTIKSISGWTAVFPLLTSNDIKSKKDWFKEIFNKKEKSNGERVFCKEEVLEFVDYIQKYDGKTVTIEELFDEWIKEKEKEEKDTAKSK